MAAARSQIRETDGIDFAEVHLVQQRPLGLHLGHVQLQPAHFRQIEFTLVIIEGVRINMVSDQPCPVGQFQDRADFVESRRLREPTNLRFACEIDKAVVAANLSRQVGQKPSNLTKEAES